MQRLALGLSYRGQGYHGWQSQPDGRTVQDAVEKALTAFAAEPVATVCAGRTDSGVHALNQVVHIDTALERDAFSWVRGSNRYLPRDVAVGIDGELYIADTFNNCIRVVTPDGVIDTFAGQCLSLIHISEPTRPY